MTYFTHKIFSISWAYLSVILLHELGVQPCNYFLSFVILLVFCQCGALFPDLDQNSVQQIHSKTDINIIVHKILRFIGAKHRSWQTHSFDICIITFVIANMLATKFFNQKDAYVAYLVFTGFWSGWLSHLISDMFSKEGVYLFCWLPKDKMIAFVPRKKIKDRALPLKIFGISILVSVAIWQLVSFTAAIAVGSIGIIISLLTNQIIKIDFKTGMDSEWEKLVQSVINVINKAGIIIVIGYGILLMFPELKEQLNISNIRDIITQNINNVKNIIK